MIEKPQYKPVRPFFSSGPCPKPESWSLNKLADAYVGRSHRTPAGKGRLKKAIELTHQCLKLPPDYQIAIVPASDTGAIELALWNLLGERAVEILAFDNFSRDWMYDVTRELKLQDVTCHETPDGQLPELSNVDTDNDVVFVWNGTTSGVTIPDASWIRENRKGLTICDATSAVFAVDMPWEKLDVVTFSWQKSLGGEAGQGMLILSPRAVRRLETWRPAWPVPKLFRLVSDCGIDTSLFEGSTINTPSMLCVEDYIFALQWVQSLGGLDAMIARTRNNYEVIDQWVLHNQVVEYLAEDPENRSRTSVCLRFTDDTLIQQTDHEQRRFYQEIADLLEYENAAYDINGYRSAPPCLRIWAGPTIETSDMKLLMPWLDWAYHEIQRRGRVV